MILDTGTAWGAGFAIKEQSSTAQGNAFAGATAGAMMQTISPTGEVLVVPAMVGSHVAVSPESEIPLITEEGEAFQGAHSPLTHYDPNATGRPRDLLLYDRRASPKSLNGS